jgi:hypothetical protein
LISTARYKYSGFPKTNPHENQEISILRIMEATKRLKLCPEVKEGPQNKDYQNCEGGATQSKKQQEQEQREQ